MTIGLVMLVLLGAVLAFAASRPSTFQISREAVVAAPADTIFPLIADFHGWSRWSPYEKRDPAMTKTYSGAPAGKGAVYEWRGNGQVGAGRIEITDAAAPSSLTLDLHMLKPMEGRNRVDFTLTPADGATRVTWAMQGRYGFVAKLMGLFVNMDRMIGKDFETGLVDLKAAAEA